MKQPLIIQHLFQVSSLEEVSRQQLETFVEEHPSFGIGHYLLSRKLRSEDPGGFQEKAQRTCLYFSNPFWLQWLLENVEDNGIHKNAAETESSYPAVEPAELVADVPAVAEVPAVEEHTTTTEEHTTVTEEHATATEEPAETPESQPENVVTMAEDAYQGDDLAEALTEGNAEKITPDEIEAIRSGEGEAIEGHAVLDEAVLNQADLDQAGTDQAVLHEAVTEASDVSAPPSAADQLLRSIEEARELRESLQKLNAPSPVDDIPVHEEPIHDEEAAFILPETVEAQASEPTPAAAAHTTTTADTPTTTTVTAEPALVFEPYHTIDYFASQGIKLSLDEQPSDALGKQLRSFTDWLKSMRRLPQKDREVVPDRVAEQAIQTFAAHSIESKDVLTETMAEVLAKQGMRERARVVYEKLSLLNPDKRAYFAAKIEQLNIP